MKPTDFSVRSRIKTRESNGTVRSQLYLASANAADSGTYSCGVADLVDARLALHILNGESRLASVRVFRAIITIQCNSFWRKQNLSSLSVGVSVT